jgi:hypothetical protein
MSFASITFGDLLKPSAPKLCTLAHHCANCGRYLPNEIRESEGFCFACERVTENYAQVWECSSCETVRMWGFGRPYETSIKQLGCIGCGQVTPHVFAYVNLGRGRLAPGKP